LLSSAALFYAVFISHLFFFLIPRPPVPTLFPYTTLFRSRGTARVAAFFGPITAIWFFAIAASGLYHIASNPEVLLAFNPAHAVRDRKSTRLNSSHVKISYAVFCLKKKRYQKSSNSNVSYQ